MKFTLMALPHSAHRITPPLSSHTRLAPLRVEVAFHAVPPHTIALCGVEVRSHFGRDEGGDFLERVREIHVTGIRGSPVDVRVVRRMETSYQGDRPYSRFS